MPRFTSFILPIILLIAGCEQHDTNQKTELLTGKVIYQNNLDARGATIFVSSGPERSNVVYQLTADAYGRFEVYLSDGIYYISIEMVTGNDRDPDNAKGFVFELEEELVIDFKKGQHLDLSLVSGLGVQADRYWDSEGWKVDLGASHVGFDIGNLEFQGQFTNFGFDDLKLSTDSPFDTKVDFWVDITSAVVGSAEADGLNGLIARVMGAQFVVDSPDDTTDTGEYTRSALVDESGIARFTCNVGSSEFFGDGYKTTGNLTLNGTTLPADVYYKITNKAMDGIIYLDGVYFDYGIDDFRVRGRDIKVNLHYRLVK